MRYSCDIMLFSFKSQFLYFSSTKMFNKLEVADHVLVHHQQWPMMLLSLRSLLARYSSMSAQHISVIYFLKKIFRLWAETTKWSKLISFVHTFQTRINFKKHTFTDTTRCVNSPTHCCAAAYAACISSTVNDDSSKHSDDEFEQRRANYKLQRHKVPKFNQTWFLNRVETRIK